MSKSKLIWIIALLAALNLVTIGTLLFHKNQEKKAIEVVTLGNDTRNPLSGRFFKQELEFNANQMETFREANRQFQPASKNIVYELDSIKQQIFIELNKASVNEQKIEELTMKFGELHAKLKKETNTFYLKIKSVSNAEQQIELKKVFENYFYRDGTNNIIRSGKGKKHRYRNGRIGCDTIN